MRTASTPLHHLHRRREYRRYDRYRDRGTRARHHSSHRHRAGAGPAEGQIRPADVRRDWQPAAHIFLEAGLRGELRGALRQVPVQAVQGISVHTSKYLVVINK